MAASPAGEAAVTLLFEGGRVHAAVPLPEDAFKAATVEGSGGNFHWLSVEGDVGAAYGVEDGVYVFDSPGVFFLRHPGARCDDLVLSPGGKIAALAEDSDAVRRWRFHTWPGMEPLGVVACPASDAELLWAEKDAGAVCTMLENGDYGRTNGDEPRAPRSAAYFDFGTKTERVLLRGTSRYDYRVVGLEGRTVTAEKATAAGAEPLPGLDVPFREERKASLPPGDCPELPAHYALAAEGRFSGMNEGDDIRALIEMLPSIPLAENVFLSLAVQDSENFAKLYAMPPESRVRVVYDMMQQWDARAGQCVVVPVIRKVETMPDNDPKG